MKKFIFTLLFVLSCSICLAFDNEPTGFRGVSFGATMAQLEEKLGPLTTRPICEGMPEHIKPGKAIILEKDVTINGHPIYPAVDCLFINDRFSGIIFNFMISPSKIKDLKPFEYYVDSDIKQANSQFKKIVKSFKKHFGNSYTKTKQKYSNEAILPNSWIYTWESDSVTVTLVKNVFMQNESPSFADIFVCVDGTKACNKVLAEENSKNK